MAAGSGTVILLARLLNPDEYGLLYFSLSVLSIATLIGSLGIAKSGARYISEYIEQDSSQIVKVISISILLNTVLISSSATFLYLFSSDLSNILGEPDASFLLAVGSVFIILSSSVELTRILLQGLEEIKLSAWTKCIAEVTKFIFSIGIVILGAGVVGALIGMIIGYLIGTIVGLIFIYRSIKSLSFSFDNSIFDKNITSRIFRYSIPITVTRGAYTLDDKIDVVFVGVFLNPVAVSYYVVSKQIIRLLAVPANSLGFTVSPSIGRQSLADESERSGEIFSISLIYTLLFYVPVCSVLVISANDVLNLFFGGEYTDASHLLQILAIYLLSLSLMSIASNPLDFMGKAKLRAILRSVSAILNAILNVLLIPMFGVTGAAIATVVSFTLYSIANIAMIFKFLDVPYGHLQSSVYEILVVTILCLSTSFAVRYLSQSIYTPIFIAVITGSVWVMSMNLLGHIEMKEVRQLV